MPRPQTRSRTVTRMAGVVLAALCMTALLSCGKSCTKAPSPVSNANSNTNTNSVARPIERPASSLGVMPSIRVAILKDAAQVRIAAGESGARIIAPTGTELRRIPARTSVALSATASGISLDGSLNITDGAVRIESLNPGETLALDDQDLAPELIVYRPLRSTKMNVVARLNLEDYLGGVLAGEVPYERWHAEAMKTQAVTSRTFALYQLSKTAAAPYDVESTIMSQVFKPGARNHPAIASAVNSTRGLALTNDGAVFCAYFHSTCGSHTEPGHLVFPDAGMVAPLRGVDCNYCAQSPAYRWRATFSKSALEQKLRVSNPSLGTIAKLEFLNAAGQPLRQYERATLVKVHHSGGVLSLQGNQFRLLADPKSLKSLSFESVTDRGDAIDIAGAGFGHGVGLCQWGSQGLAQVGYGYAQILGKYFPGAELTRMY